MPVGSASHLTLIPSYHTGAALLPTVRGALRQGLPVWVVLDGGAADDAAALAALREPGLRVVPLPRRQGKGGAVLQGLRAAAQCGYTHALVMDADGQHPAWMIPAFMAASRANPDAMILGRPLFDHSAPWLRVVWRRVSNALVHWETGGQFIADSLFGFRVYPIAPLCAIMESTRWMRGFDFDAEAAVRLFWRGVRPITLDAPVRYFTAAEGGVSHFRYGRHNALLAWMHLRLLWARLSGAGR